MSIDRQWVLDRLEELRKEPTEDAVLDLMDRVDGWCSSHMLPTIVRVGDDPVEPNYDWLNDT